MKIAAIANRKGGTGKTTTAVNLAACLAELGHEVVLIDLDPQGNASASLSQQRHYGETGSLALLRGSASPDFLIEETPQAKLRLIPASADLAVADMIEPKATDWQIMLKRNLNFAEPQPEFVFIDCPPALGVLTINALTAANGVLVPLQCDYFSLEGLREFAANIEALRAQLNPSLILYGLLRTIHDSRTVLSRQIDSELQRHFGDKLLPTIIPRTVRLAEAPSFGLPVILHDSSSKGAAAYRAAARDLLRAIVN